MRSRYLPACALARDDASAFSLERCDERVRQLSPVRFAVIDDDRGFARQRGRCVVGLRRGLEVVPPGGAKEEALPLVRKINAGRGWRYVDERRSFVQGVGRLRARGARPA